MIRIQNTKFICSAAILLNVLISYFILFYKQPFNVDGIVYLNAAQSFLSDGLKGALTVYIWPFYSILIAELSRLTHLSLENAAFLLNAGLTALLVTSFILLIKEMGGTITEQYWGLLVILIYPFLNHERHHILRDFGYYAFLLLSLLFFLRYLRELNWRYALSWSISIIIATLFRLEGAALLVFLPFAIFLKSKINFYKRIIGFIQLNTFNIIIVIAILIGAIHSEHMSMFFKNIIHNASLITDNLAEKKMLLKQSVLNGAGADWSYMFLLGGLTTVFFDTFLGALNLFYTALIIYIFAKKLVPANANVKLCLSSYSIVILVTLFVFLLQHFFMSGRYVAPLCFILMLSIPFGLSKIFSKKNGLRFVVGFLFLVMAVDSFGYFGPSKTYIVDAGHWIKQNTSPHDRLYSNDPSVAYYSERQGTHYPESFRTQDKLILRLKKIHMGHYDYLAIRINHSEIAEKKPVLKFLQKQPVASFHNKRGDEVLVFKIK